MSITSYQKFFELKNKLLDPLPFEIFPFLSKGDRQSLNLVDRIWNKAKLDFDTNAYWALGHRTEENKEIYVITGTTVEREKILKVLGNGTWKKAVELTRDRALVVPRMNLEDFSSYRNRQLAESWERMVHEEVAMSECLAELGLLGVQSQRVNLSFSGNPHEGKLLAYISNTFASLKKTEGWSIIDINNINSTWKEKLFESAEQRLKDENWDSVVNSLLTDLATLGVYDICPDIDSLNMAVVKNRSESAVSPYEIRYFGFDFSKKYKSLTIPQIGQKPSERPTGLEAILVFGNILHELFLFEFGIDYHDDNSKSRKLKERLVKRYSDEIISRTHLLYDTLPSSSSAVFQIVKSGFNSRKPC